ncbi:hypothetical protein [Streptomyces sp. RerS4]|uniref:hypothetical protein n=1 Tax=Streptomyces sp. RerS4 TaxID=2942449 RepID=UPI00201C633B|nr:hypothetical protein [Streptomyces sp. RerS4]UQX05461.1 hypothetical protein M4D82_33840 [Streptomyces sp. RerS4]
MKEHGPRPTSAEAVLAAHRGDLDALTHAVHGDVDAATRLTGHVIVEPGARVVASWIEGPAVIAAGSLIERAHIGPYASIGRDCVVRGTHVEDSIVLDGATVHPVGRLSGALIARAAVVGSPAAPTPTPAETASRPTGADPQAR